MSGMPMALRITDLLKNTFFWCYAEMLLNLHEVLEYASSWAEGCWCHDEDLSIRLHHEDQHIMFGNGFCFVINATIGDSSVWLVRMGMAQSSCIKQYFGRALQSVYLWVLNFIRQHFENAVECNAELFGRPALKPFPSLNLLFPSPAHVHQRA
jgi:hypothetical protein